jgi:ectoine hydroxylase-related dioxygenase (phytanoyl-CoA dioxygenase family)
MAPTSKTIPCEPYQDSTALLDSPQGLRDQLEREGYLFLRSLLPKDAVLEVRRDFTALLASNGLLRFGTDPMDALADPDAEELHPEWSNMDVCAQFTRLESFNTISHHPAIINLLERIFGETPLPHGRLNSRLKFPKAEADSAQSHQDYLYIQGSKRTVTCWFPVGDCPQEIGGLAVIRGSNHAGLLPTRWIDSAQRIREVILEDPNPVWTQGDFALGDVLIFTCMTVHRGLPNSSDRVRMSCDFRYQPLSEPVTARSLRPVIPDLAWEEVYRDWKSDRYQYYWKKMGPTIVEHDPEVALPK